MHNLLVEIGNTAIKATWADGITLGKTFRYQGERILDYILSLLRDDKADILIICSVSDISQKWVSVLTPYCKRLVIMDSRHTDVNTSLSLPSWLNPDRTASVVASRFLFRGKSVSIFDLGTTLSMDFIDESGIYKGGKMSPGCRTRFKAMYRYSRSLPLLDTPDEYRETGNSIASCMESGIISGIVFELEGNIASYPSNIVVFTGGDANFFAKKMKNSIFVVCNLVLMGLALIAKNFYESNL